MACCDKELIGKTLSDGKLFFEVKEKFYKGFEVSGKKLAGLLKQAGNANLVGKKAVGTALKEGLISKNSIRLIQNIPHVQIFKL